MALRKTSTTKNEPRSGSTTLCRDLPGIQVVSENTRINKKKGEKGLAAFNRWSEDEANGWCESGLCSSGKCLGERTEISVRLLKETDEFIEVAFSFKIKCKCG